MDQNASANVQGTQPDPITSADVIANGTNPAPEASDVAKGADQTTDPGAGVSGFDPEVQKFLDNQNIKTDNLQEAVAELARRNMKLRSQPKTETQEVADVLNPAPTPAPEVKEEPKVEPQQTSQPRGLSDMDIANVSLFVKQQYPDVKTDANFYRAMIDDGFRPTTADGQINLKSVMSYAAYKQRLIEADKVIAANQPQSNQLPQPSNAPEYAQVDRIQTMTEQAAQNIVMFSNQEKRYGRPIHPQYDEAVKFLQGTVR